MCIGPKVSSCQFSPIKKKRTNLSRSIHQDLRKEMFKTHGSLDSRSSGGGGWEESDDGRLKEVVSAKDGEDRRRLCLREKYLQDG